MPAEVMQHRWHAEVNSMRRQALLWQSFQLFFQIIQAGFKVGQPGRGNLLTSRRTTPHPNVGRLRVTTQALQFDSQLIECGINARQISSCSSLGLLELRNAITQLLYPCRHRLVAWATLTWQGGGVSRQHLQLCITRTAHYQARQEQAHQYEPSFHSVITFS